MSPPENRVEIQPDLLIPMRDGVRLAATLYRPRDDQRKPCLINYLPYHKDARGGLWYDPMHRFFAQRGYATLVVDFRGLGCSEGSNNIPFDAQEGRDGHDLVEWAASQPWCNGNVGMWGTSYGGITALKTAAEKPTHLKAIVPIHATTDNYLDFLLLGGCRNGFWPNGDWGPRMIAYNLTPPLGADPDGRLRRLWMERLEHSEPWCLDWYNPENEAARWAERVIQVERITAATFAVCGWKDFYVQGTFDYFQRITAPKRLLMGPWKHVFPNLSPVEPVNLLEMMVQWWDRWLLGKVNETKADPPIAIFVQGKGQWRHEETWPPLRNETHELSLSPGGVLATQPATRSHECECYRYDPTVGLDSISFDPWTTTVTNPGNHNGDDARSLCFTTEPLAEEWECSGQARALLTARASVPGLNFVAKLCDVHPDGQSRLVSMGWCPDPSADPQAVHEVEIPLRSTSHVFQKGHRLRLNVALADFPRLWPTPHPGQITLEYGGLTAPRLTLPRTPPQRPALPEAEFPPLEAALRSEFDLQASQSWRIGRELVEQTGSLESCGLSRYRLRDGRSITYRHEYTASVSSADPASVAIHVRSDIEVNRAKGAVVVKVVSLFTPTSVSIDARIEENNQLVYQGKWQR